MLETEFQEIVKIHIVEGTTIKELAKIYGVSPSGLRTRFSRSKIKANRSCWTPGKGRSYCWKCKKILPDYLFGDKKKKKSNHCLDCGVKMGSEIEESVRRLRNIKSTLKFQFGITPEDRVAMMDKQKGCCAICGDSLINPKFNKADLHIDHDHTTGKTRGLLCGKCNTALGSFRDSRENLIKAIQYLEEHE